MKTRIFLFIFVFLLPAASFSQAGILRRAINRQVNNEIDSLLDKKVQEEQDKNRAKAKEAAAQENQSQQAEGAKAESSQDKQSGSGGGLGASLFGNKVDLKYKDEYGFTSRIYMKMETYDKKEVAKMDFYMYYSANSPSLGVETKTITTEDNESVPLAASMVVDGDNKIFLMLTEVNAMKVGTISAIPDENAAAGTDGKTTGKVTTPVFTRTGNTRIVAGYKCDEYTYVYPEEKTKGKVWFTKEPRVMVDKRGWNNTGMAAYYGYSEFRDGIILASEGYDEKGNLLNKAETIEINQNYPHTITAKGYTLRQINLDQASGKKN